MTDGTTWKGRVRGHIKRWYDVTYSYFAKTFYYNEDLVYLYTIYSAFGSQLVLVIDRKYLTEKPESFASIKP